MLDALIQTLLPWLGAPRFGLHSHMTDTEQSCYFCPSMLKIHSGGYTCLCLPPKGWVYTLHFSVSGGVTTG